MFFYSLRRTLVFDAFFAGIIHIPPLLLVVRNGPLRSLAGPGVGFASLAADRKSAPMADAPIASDFGQPLDVQRRLTAQVAFHDISVVYFFAEFCLLLIG